ncbi:MAG TPA: hypothetical protein VER96_35985 [Polyangiaceae bacterium]|nr:hypothetical protein [Polyangiaceae bacterium]
MSVLTSRGAGFGLLFWLAAVPARAAITVQIPPECGSQPDFARELEQRLGELGTRETTRVTLTPEPDGYHLVVEAGNQSRELHDANCEELRRAAVVIALALLEPKRDEPTPPVVEPEQPPPPPAATPERTPAPAEANPVKHATHPQFAIGAGAGVHVGTLPKATLMIDVDAQLKWTRFGVAAGFRYLLPNETRDADGVGAKIGGLGASLAGLFEPIQRVQVRVGVVTYHLSGSGIGSLQNTDGSAWEVAPTLGAAFVPFQRPPFWTCVGLEGQLNLIRPTFEILSHNNVFQVYPLSGSAFAHVGVVF